MTTSDTFEERARAKKLGSDLIRFCVNTKLHDMPNLQSANVNDTARVVNGLLTDDCLTCEEFIYLDPEWMDTKDYMSIPIEKFKEYLEKIGITDKAADWNGLAEEARKMALGSLATRLKRVFISCRVVYEKGEAPEVDEGEPLSLQENKTLLTMFVLVDGRKDLSQFLPHLSMLGKMRKCARKGGHFTHIPLVKLVAQTSAPLNDTFELSTKGIKRGQESSSGQKFLNNVFEILVAIKLWITGFRMASIDLTDDDGDPIISGDTVHRLIEVYTKMVQIYSGHGQGRLMALRDDGMRQLILDKKNGRGMSVGKALESALDSQEEKMMGGPTVLELEIIASRNNGKGSYSNGQIRFPQQKWQDTGGKGKGHWGGKGGGKGGKGNDMHGLRTAASANWQSRDGLDFCLFYNDQRGGRGCDAGPNCKKAHVCDILVNGKSGWQPCHGDHSRIEHVQRWGVPK